MLAWLYNVPERAIWTLYVQEGKPPQWKLGVPHTSDEILVLKF
jgi:hypothetical protein